MRVTAAILAIAMAWPVAAYATGATARAKQADQVSTAASKDSLEGAGTYFDRSRKMGFPAAGQTTPYVLKAEFTTRGASGVVETGTYTDTWMSDARWRREATLGNSRFVRSRDGKKEYRETDGPDAALLQYVLTAMEPLPATDALFREQDWNVRRDSVDGVAMIRVATGRENPDGTPDPKEFYGFWFDDSGQLVKSYGSGLETQRSNFVDFNGVKVGRSVNVTTGGKVGMQISVTALGPAGKVDGSIFKLKGHNWERQYTFEVR